MTMNIAASEERARDAVVTLHRVLSNVSDSAADYHTAKRASSLLVPFLDAPMDQTYCASLCGTLSKGIGDCAWSDSLWAQLQPLIEDASTKVIQHVDAGTSYEA